jgi:hypothetical protein
MYAADRKSATYVKEATTFISRRLELGLPGLLFLLVGLEHRSLPV